MEYTKYTLQDYIAKHKKDIIKMCKSYNSSERYDDLFGEVVLKMLSSTKFDTTKPFLPWARRVVATTIIDQDRKYKTQKNTLNREAVSVDDNYDPQNIGVPTLDLQDTRVSLKALNFNTKHMALNSDVRKTLFLTIFGMELSAIADRLGLSEHTIRAYKTLGIKEFDYCL